MQKNVLAKTVVPKVKKIDTPEEFPKTGIVKILFSFIVDVLLWLFDVLAYLIRRTRKMMKVFFTRENFKNNWPKIAMVLLAIVGLAWGISKYKIIFIPNDISKQTSAERVFLSSPEMRSSQPGQTRQASAPVNVRDGQTQPVVMGKIKKAGADQIVIIQDSNQQEKTITINSKTVIMPPDMKLKNDERVTVFSHAENGNVVADRVSIDPSPSNGSGE